MGKTGCCYCNLKRCLVGGSHFFTVLRCLPLLLNFTYTSDMLVAASSAMKGDYCPMRYYKLITNKMDTVLNLFCFLERLQKSLMR